MKNSKLTVVFVVSVILVIVAGIAGGTMLFSKPASAASPDQSGSCVGAVHAADKIMTDNSDIAKMTLNSSTATDSQFQDAIQQRYLDMAVYDQLAPDCLKGNSHA